ncbi:hypothetical protein G6O69_30200 [Pseudenhygromyxa sp. WMMC2535]|uniref:M66 family metalloprotease n=1 Tax=Pseudenhygromyxa sp. WMMC2535 TaxID=2712867 RepID=UPI0015549611|nr:M66 family metalloprotease [Pseudenhygromyxa sp. WMMC2535]NVB42133.1 hypothetical protein [Pseudenhygromyxa sp. WMMC2535]
MRLYPCPVILALALALPLVACGPDDVTLDGTQDSIGGSDEDADTSAGYEPVPARGGIGLEQVVVNQGVDVTIAQDGQWVDAVDRNSYILSGRNTLIRGYWSFPDDWTPRNILCRLEIEWADGTTSTREVTQYIDAVYYPGAISRTFTFDFDAEAVQPGMKFRMSLWEADETGWEDIAESTDAAIVAPDTGLDLIGVQAEPMQMKVVFVPVQYDNGGSCVTDTSQITEEQEQKFIDYLYDQNPTQEIIWDFRRDEPIVRSAALTSISLLHAPLQNMREADGADANTYYYALVDVCGGGIDGAAGIAAGIPPATKDAAFNRVAAGVWLSTSDYTYETFVHEIGHTQGRSHIFCQGGNSAGNDPSYPYDNGHTSVWGFGLNLFEFFSPSTTYDYMTYCQPVWTSDWTWSKSFVRIATLTAWDFESPSADDDVIEGEVLIGLLLNDGTEEWWTAKGGREDEFFSGAQQLRFDVGGESLDVPAAVEVLEDGTTRLTAPVPRTTAPVKVEARIDSEGDSHALNFDMAIPAPWRVAH